MKKNRAGCSGAIFNGMLTFIFSVILFPFAFFVELLKNFPKFRTTVIAFFSLTIACGLIATAVEELSNGLWDAPSVLTVLLLLSACVFCGVKVYRLFRRRRDDSVAVATLREVDVMSGLEFEEYTAQLLRKLGYSHVTVTKSSGDQGIDVLAQNGGIKYAIQCKNYTRKLGNTPVQEAYAGKTFYGCDVAVVITNSTFTDGAYELAHSTGVLLWDRSILRDMILQANNTDCGSCSEDLVLEQPLQPPPSNECYSSTPSATDFADGVFTNNTVDPNFIAKAQWYAKHRNEDASEEE